MSEVSYSRCLEGFQKQHIVLFSHGIRARQAAERSLPDRIRSIDRHDPHSINGAGVRPGHHALLAPLVVVRTYGGMHRRVRERGTTCQGDDALFFDRTSDVVYC